jgi:hypothetical protein
MFLEYLQLLGALIATPLLALATLGCSGCNDTVGANSTETTGTGGGVSTTSSSVTGTGGGTMVDRGPKLIPLSISPNGIFWDAPTNTLLVADDDGNRVLVWTDEKGFGTPIALPAAPANGPGLGQVIKTKDGTILVARFGFGTAGDIAFVKSDGTTGTVPGLDKTKRRIGLAESDDGRLFDTYFEAVPTGYSGSVAEFKITGTETDIVSTLAKPVGVVAVGGTLFFDDQSSNQISDLSLANTKSVKVLATLDAPDLLSAGPNGTIFTGGGAEARQVFADGHSTTVGSGFMGVRGVSYDAANKRLFIADHDGMTIGIQPID